MKIVTASRTTAKFGFLITLFGLFATGFAQVAEPKAPNPTGKIFVAETEGGSSIIIDDKIVELLPKSVYPAKGATLETQPNANLAVVYSNGTGLSLESDTLLEIIRFQQEPFAANRSDLELEPSISQTLARLIRGGISISTNKMAAGSTMNYQTRHIDISIRGSKVIIETNDAATTVSVLKGSATLRDGNRSGGQSLLVGQQAIITRISAIEQPVININTIPESAKTVLENKSALAAMARSTVYFEVSDRKNTNANLTQNIFNRTETEEDVLVPVTLLPGTITGTNTVSPFRITRAATP